MTPLQARALTFVRTYQRQHGGVSPSLEEMRMGLGLGSKSGPHRLLTALERQGRISRDGRRPRSVAIIGGPPDLSAVPSEILRDELALRDRELSLPATKGEGT